MYAIRSYYAAACDLRIAAEDAVCRMPAGRLGLGYNYPGIKRFVDLMGPANTADIFFSARKFDAADALRMGFVNRVVPVAQLDAALGEYVITSYSIHYTKLYEPPSLCSPWCWRCLPWPWRSGRLRERAELEP